METTDSKAQAKQEAFDHGISMLLEAIRKWREKQDLRRQILTLLYIRYQLGKPLS